jgi:MFS family permease
MSISYSQPLSRGFQRMKEALFQPFDITKWFKVGFTAWLAGLTDCNGGSGGYNGGSNNTDWNDFFNFPDIAWNWLSDNPIWANLILVGVVFLIIIVSVFIWLSARGKFMFLHNVVHDKSEISEPWHKYRKQGNSLFWFEFVLGWFAFAVFVLLAIYFFVSAKELYFGDYPKPAVFLSILQMMLLFIAYIVFFGYITLFEKDFVIPIMYKHQIGVIKAWGKFLPLLGQKLFTFLIYGLFIFVLGIAVGIGVLFFAVITCCVGLLLIAIPYIGSVVLLPVSYTFRAFSIEFLAQFGDDFNVFPKDDLGLIAEEPEK